MKFHQNVKPSNWEYNAPFWEVFAHFLFGKGLIFSPRFGLGKSLGIMLTKDYNILLCSELKKVDILHVSINTWTK